MEINSFQGNRPSMRAVWNRHHGQCWTRSYTSSQKDSQKGERKGDRRGSGKGTQQGGSPKEKLEPKGKAKVKERTTSQRNRRSSEKRINDVVGLSGAPTKRASSGAFTGPGSALGASPGAASDVLRLGVACRGPSDPIENAPRIPPEYFQLQLARFARCSQRALSVIFLR